MDKPSFVGCSAIQANWLAASALGGTWNQEEVSISLHTFHHVARGTLLRWWDSMAPRSAPEATAQLG